MMHNLFEINPISLNRMKVFLGNFVFLGIIVFCFVYITSFFLLSLIYLSIYKLLVLLLIPWVIILLFLFYFSPSLRLNSIFSIGFFTLKSFFILLISIAVTSGWFLLNVNSIPSLNQLEISVFENDNSDGLQKSIDILEIGTINSEDLFSIIPGFQIITEDKTDLENSILLCPTCSNKTARYQEFSNNGLNILFQGSPTGAKAIVNWNGKSQIVDTYRNPEDQFALTLPYRYFWDQQSVLKKVECIALFISLVICLFIIILFIANSKNFIKSSLAAFNYKTRTILITGLFFLLTIINIINFAKYQTNDTYKLQWVPGNTLIDLDKTSHDNIKNFQVYMNFWSYYRNHDLISPTGLLDSLRLSRQTFIDFSRIKSVSEKDYNPELSSTQFSKIMTKKLVTIMPAGVIPFRYELDVDFQDENSGICIWQFDGTIYFIPVQDEFNCLKDTE